MEEGTKEGLRKQRGEPPASGLTSLDRIPWKLLCLSETFAHVMSQGHSEEALGTSPPTPRGSSVGVSVVFPAGSRRQGRPGWAVLPAERVQRPRSSAENRLSAESSYEMVVSRWRVLSHLRAEPTAGPRWRGPTRGPPHLEGWGVFLWPRFFAHAGEADPPHRAPGVQCRHGRRSALPLALSRATHTVTPPLVLDGPVCAAHARESAAPGPAERPSRRHRGAGPPLQDPAERPALSVRSAFQVRLWR